MFQINDVVVYGAQGVCKIVGTQDQKITGAASQGGDQCCKAEERKEHRLAGTHSQTQGRYPEWKHS